MISVALAETAPESRRISRAIPAPLDSSDGTSAVPIGPDTPLTRILALRTLSIVRNVPGFGAPRAYSPHFHPVEFLNRRTIFTTFERKKPCRNSCPRLSGRAKLDGLQDRCVHPWVLFSPSAPTAIINLGAPSSRLPSQALPGLFAGYNPAWRACANRSLPPLSRLPNSAI